MQHELLTVDLGPEFLGWTAEVAGRIVCVAPDRIHVDPSARRVVRELVRLQGGDCGSCPLSRCPMASAN